MIRLSKQSKGKTMKPHFYWLVLAVIITGFLNLGAILKKEDHIAATQTDPILYEKKMEELKDGEKGPSMPKIEYYKKADFLSKTPVATQGNEQASVETVRPSEWPEELPAEVGKEKAETSDEYWWIDEDEVKAGSAGKAPPSYEQPAPKNGGNENSLKESAEGDDWLD